VPVASGELQEFLSLLTGSSGGAIAGSAVTSAVNNNVWPDITDAERIAGGSRYRKTFWKNTSGASAALKPIIFAPVLPSNCTLSLGLGTNDAADNDPLQGNMTVWTAAAVVSAVSDGTDARTLTIYGMNNAVPAVPIVETLVLNGTTPVSSVTTWTKVWAVFVSSTASQTISVKQGPGGTVRGTIGVNKKACWLWVASPAAKANGIALPDLAAGANYGLWRKLTWTAGTTPTRPNSMSISIEENA
jgi:hypothetical protein